jgi:hypothetical protein
METTTRTLLCGDLFTQGGDGKVPITTGDILGPSEAFRKPMDYYAHAPSTHQDRAARARGAADARVHAWERLAGGWGPAAEGAGVGGLRGVEKGECG